MSNHSGSNFLIFEDMQQLPPIPASLARFIPPAAKKTMTAREILDIFWSNRPDALNFFKELTMQKRIADAWFDCFLQECRAGHLTDEMYKFFHKSAHTSLRQLAA